MILDRVLTEEISLMKADGSVYDNIPAGVQSECIFVTDVSLPIECGDKITRRLPSGVEETFIVLDPGYEAGLGPIKPHYQIKYQRPAGSRTTQSAQNITYNLTGAHSRVNIDSVDKSLNVDASQSISVLSDIRDAMQTGIEDDEERERLLDALDELSRAHGTEKFVDTYKTFVAMAANHMAFLAPFLPALSELL